MHIMHVICAFGTGDVAHRATCNIAMHRSDPRRCLREVVPAETVDKVSPREQVLEGLTQRHGVLKLRALIWTCVARVERT